MTEKAPAKKKRKKSTRGGRPPWVPSLANRTTVEQMKFCGESEEVIARSLGVDVDTLRKHCKAELLNGHANQRREVIGLLFESAKAKNTTAIKRLEELGRISGAAQVLEDRASAGVAAAVAPAAAKDPKLGKKELRQQAAERVVGIYSPPEPPKLVVNNGS